MGRVGSLEVCDDTGDLSSLWGAPTLSLLSELSLDG